MNIIFQINGGIGKCVIATAVCEAIKKKYPESKLIIVSGYPEVFINNPKVDRSYNFGGFTYFYEEYVENKDLLVFAHDPYLDTQHIQQKEHLIQTWCRMFDLDYNGEEPKIYLSEIEKISFMSKFITDKPILLIQTNGGVQSELNYSWARDLPYNVVNEVIGYFRNDYNIVHIKREDQITYENTFPVTGNFRELSSLIELSHKRLFIDSFAQHTAKALGKKSTVCWIVNNPNVFGYTTNDNILANPFTKKPELIRSYLNKFDITGNPFEFPYNNENEIFDVDKIIESIIKQ
jgi:hypothetical protein